MNPNFNQPLIIQPKPSGKSHEVRPRGISRKKIIFGILLMAVLIFLVIFGVQLFKSYQTNKNVLTSAQVLVAVNKLMLLPTDETPTIKTITTLDGLDYQPFFMNAAVGDQVIVFEKAKRAVIYRPSINKIVEASRIN